MAQLGSKRGDGVRHKGGGDDHQDDLRLGDHLIHVGACNQALWTGNTLPRVPLPSVLECGFCTIIILLSYDLRQMIERMD